MSILSNFPMLSIFKQFSSCCPILSDFSSLSILSNFVQLMLPQVVFEPESFHFLHSNSNLEVVGSNPSEGNHIFSCPKNSQIFNLYIFWPFFRPLFNHFGPFLDHFGSIRTIFGPFWIILESFLEQFGPTIEKL